MANKVTCYSAHVTNDIGVSVGGKNEKSFFPVELVEVVPWDTKHPKAKGQTTV